MYCNFDGTIMINRRIFGFHILTVTQSPIFIMTRSDIAKPHQFIWLKTNILISLSEKSVQVHFMANHHLMFPIK